MKYINKKIKDINSDEFEELLQGFIADHKKSTTHCEIPKNFKFYNTVNDKTYLITCSEGKDPVSELVPNEDPFNFTKSAGLTVVDFERTEDD